MIQASSEPIPASPAVQPTPRVVDDRYIVEFGLRDLALVHLHNPIPRDVAAFRERFGAPLKFTDRAPDICFRFVERLSLPPEVCFVGDDVAFTPEQFFLRRPRSGDRALACLPMDRLGLGGEVILESGTEPPLLEEILNLCVLQRGGIALHASAFEFEGQGGVVGGWPHGGKTAVLIGMIGAGAKFVSDDWTFLHPDGAQVFGQPGPIQVRERYLREIPDLLARVSGGGRTRANVLRAGAGAARLAAHMPPARRPAARVAHALEERQKLSLDPQALFGAERCLPSTQLESFIVCVASAEPEVVARPMPLPEAVARTLGSLEYERRKLRSHYLQFQFAFPDRKNPLLEQTVTLEEERLRKALEGRNLVLLQHPPLASPVALAEALAPLLRAGEQAG
jgi:hypothetical protein